jgi:hypothetical protein
MQTFLPYADFEKSAKVLDRQRLGKQRLETLTILNILSGKSSSKGWRNHPATKMWQDHEYALAEYGSVICKEWINRGYKDNMLPSFVDYLNQFSNNKTLPNWIGNQSFHDSHKSNLLRKNAEFYGVHDDFVVIGPDLPYIWPV